ncbi:hypothetical protein SS1G_00315 [Sclerotinia sclerotiorum 1980 UF-70]|uniref:Major facilitator superfamily (MFS) profile domain-containing protein n=2 Tax=Sclerotinia sclerotiorum (strain ATCC 18683 / 1980 / Ss-1) TaxID=665079 RepID=A7E4U3_SCLS1|nr:hypothetical protein SS1G_00315 [Sclerotinia sclerotiorum 1980 UF-70]APA08040.1 hypothetical protein sscle_03g028100 [Sclerotinia sclerotiorum 1980 UF-70]EDN90915.1 hypothetical protein SS1G_00315 [Sclerotinia sclerotiorum 1980 UF-70]
MESVSSSPVANDKPTSPFNQAHGATEQPQPLSSQEQASNTSVQQEAEAMEAPLGSRPNGIFIIEPNHPRYLEPSEDDVERSTEFFDNKEQQDSAVTSSANSLYVVKKESEEPPYHIFSMAQKRQLVYIVSFAGLFSPLSSNIYFPSLKEISTDLHVSLSLVSLTVTVYMIVQGLAPSFWGPISDTKGRRITFMGTFIVYLASNIGLALSKNFTTLMVLRAIQAAGSAATIAVGAGAIADCTTPKERGGLIGVFGGIRMLGQSVGPVLGGIITQYLGFRAIFWFLLGLGSLALLLIIAFLPETLRSVAGNGSVVLKGVHRPLFYTPPSTAQSDEELPPKKNITFSSVFAPFKFLLEKDVFITLFFGAVVYTVWSMVTSSTTALFSEHFNLSNLELGLIFLPNGFGCITGSYLTGMLMDYDYKVVESRYRKEHNVPADVTIKANELLDFPIEVARMRNIWWIVLVFIVATGLYGYSLKLEIMALPLILQFFIAYTATAVFSLNSALIIDLYPGKSASATAVNNLIRCLLGAAGVAVVQLIIDVLGSGVTFLIFAGATFALSPLLMIEWYHGGRWKRERAEKLQKKKEAKQARDLERAA